MDFTVQTLLQSIQGYITKKITVPSEINRKQNFSTSMNFTNKAPFYLRTDLPFFFPLSLFRQPNIKNNFPHSYF